MMGDGARKVATILRAAQFKLDDAIYALGNEATTSAEITELAEEMETVSKILVDYNQNRAIQPTSRLILPPGVQLPNV